MTTPTNENRDTDRPDTDRIDRIDRRIDHTDGFDRIDTAAPETRHRLDLSITKVAAAACASAIAAAVGSKLGVGGTIIGAAVASAVATSASAVIGHSLERGKTAARKAIPVALTPLDATRARSSLADRALTDSAVDEAVAIDEAPRTWKDRIPGRKPLIAAGLASFLIGTGAVTALEVARKGEFPGYHSNVFTDPGQSGGSHDQPSEQNHGGNGSHGSTPSQKPDSSSPTPSGSGSGSSSPSTIPSTPQTSGSTSSSPSTPPTTPSTGPTTPSTGPTSAPTGGTSPTSVPSTNGGQAPSSTVGMGNGTPTGGPTG